MIDTYELTNVELEEMGVPTCACLITYNEITDDGYVYEVCADCGAARRMKTRVPAWS